jgi:hypothetical protein
MTFLAKADIESVPYWTYETNVTVTYSSLSLHCFTLVDIEVGSALRLRQAGLTDRPALGRAFIKGDGKKGSRGIGFERAQPLSGQIDHRLHFLLKAFDRKGDWSDL